MKTTSSHNLLRFAFLLIQSFAFSLGMNAQSTMSSGIMYVYGNGSAVGYAIDHVDSIVFVKPTLAVDLGLSVKWADINVGASVPEGKGGLFAWGETESHENEEGTVDNYTYYVNGEFQSIGENIGGTLYDVAHVQLGGTWRMPTIQEFQELSNNCSWRWTTRNGVWGYIVTGSNGNSIFLPAPFDEDWHPNGSYWSSNQVDDDITSAHCFYFDWGGYYTYEFYHNLRREIRRTVRAVCP